MPAALLALAGILALAGKLDAETARQVEGMDPPEWDQAEVIDGLIALIQGAKCLEPSIRAALAENRRMMRRIRRQSRLRRK